MSAGSVVIGCFRDPAGGALVAGGGVVGVGGGGASTAARTLGLWLAGRHAGVAIVAAASHGEFREEDRVCCALVAGELRDAGYAPEDGATAALVRRWRTASPDAWLVSNSVRYLRATGQIADLEFILAHQDDLPDVFQVQHGEVITVPAGVALPA